MKFDIEHGITNRIYRAFVAFAPLKCFSYEPLTLATLARRYARGNVKLQMGKIMSNKQYQGRKAWVLSHEFIKI